jgi:hypothetical protein
MIWKDKELYVNLIHGIARHGMERNGMGRHTIP